MERLTGRIQLDLGNRGKYVSFFSGQKPEDLERSILDQVKEYFSSLGKRKKKSGGSSFIRVDNITAVAPVITKRRRRRRKK